eukprot:7565484-Ditylum_brightwellii.AAC.1
MEAYMATLEKWEQDFIQNVEILVPLDELIEFMKQGTCLIATDGSAGDDIILFVWKDGDVDDNAYFCCAVYLENEGMIDRIKKQKTYLFETSLHTIGPDWDTIS